MGRFTPENFDATLAELEILNAAFDRLSAANPGIDPGNLADRLCNTFVPGMDADALVQATGWGAA